MILNRDIPRGRSTVNGVKENEDVELAIAELQSLGKRKPLGEEEMVRAKREMKTLKENGFTNNEISTLSGNRWQEPTIKQYTLGTKIVDSTIKEQVIKFFAEAIHRGFGLDKLHRGLELDYYCRRRNVTVEEVATAVSNAKAHGTNPQEFVDNYHKAKQGMKRVVYQHEQADKQLKAKKTNIDNLERTEQILSKRVAKIQNELNEFDRLKAKGFDESALNELGRMTSKLGGPKKVFKEIAKYTKHKNLGLDILRLERQKYRVLLQVKQSRDKLTKMQPIAKMCQEMYKAGYSTETVKDLRNAAQKYGQPNEVFRAVSKFGSNRAREAEIKRKQRQLEELENKIQDAEGAYAASMDLLSDLINLLGEKTKEGLENVVKVSNDSITNIKAEADEYAKRLAAAEIFEKELGLARVIASVKNYPAEAAKLPLDYLILILRAISYVLAAKALNPTVNIVSQLIARKKPAPEAPIIDLLDVCTQALGSEMRF